MTSISDSYASLVANTAQIFQRSTAAAAFFYWGDNSDRGLRLESLELMLEFTNNVKFGRDPEGLLFFNDVQSFGDGMKSGYKVYYNSEGQKAIKVDFYRTADTTKGAPFAVFVARDEEGIDTSKLVDGAGTWNTLSTGAIASKIHKVDNYPTVTITAAPIRKSVRFNIAGTTTNPIMGNGVLYFTDLDNLSGSNCKVNYTPDRVIFYDSTDPTKTIAVFFPSVGTALTINNDGLDNPTATWGPYP